MKKFVPSKTSIRAFSMIELMVVVGIMVILAGMLIASLPGIQTRVSRNNVEAFMAELESGLSKYQIDHGTYPLNRSDGDRDEDGVEGSEVLYQHLSGDFNLDGEIDFLDGQVEDGEIERAYVEKLDLDSNRDAKSPRSTDRGGAPQVMDAFGNPFRYLADPPNISQSERNTYNPTYDLWSITDTDPNNDDDQSRHITNWQAN